MANTNSHIKPLLSEYMDNALAASDKRTVEKHLEQCKECADAYKEMKALKSWMKTTPALTPPERLYRGVLDRIEREQRPWYVLDWPVTTKWIATFGVLVVIVMVTREARRSQPELFAPLQSAREDKAAAPNHSAPLLDSLQKTPAALAGTSAPAESAKKAELVPISSGEGVQAPFEPLAHLKDGPRPVPFGSGVIARDSNESMGNGVGSISGGTANSPQTPLFQRGDASEKETVLAEMKPALKNKLATARRASAFSTSEDAALATTENAAVASSPAQVQTKSFGKGIDSHEEARDIRGQATQGSFMQNEKKLAARKDEVDLGTRQRPKSIGGVSGSSDIKTAAPVQREIHAADQLSDRGSTQWNGALSGVTAFRTAIVTSVEEWKQLWKEHTSPEVPPPPAPEVDFSRFTAVAIFAGQKPTMGYSISIVDVQDGPQTITVTYREQAPAHGMMSAQALSAPFVIRLIPKTSLPVQFVKIQ